MSSQRTNDKIGKNAIELNHIWTKSTSALITGYPAPACKHWTAHSGSHEDIATDRLSNVIMQILFFVNLVCPSDSGPKALSKRDYVLPHLISVKSFIKKMECKSFKTFVCQSSCCQIRGRTDEFPLTCGFQGSTWMLTFRGRGKFSNSINSKLYNLCFDSGVLVSTV